MRWKRVVVTGMGIVSSIGCNLSTAWQNVINGKSGIKHLGAEFEKLPCQVGGLINKDHLPEIPNENSIKLLTPASKYALIAASEAITDSGLDMEDERVQSRTGVSIGNLYANAVDVYDAHEKFELQGYKGIDPMLISKCLMHMPATLISYKYNLGGPLLAPVAGTTTGIFAIALGFKNVRYYPDIDVMIVGGTESCLSPFMVGSYCQLNQLSTHYNDVPEHASRPFDKQRDGWVPAEGAGVLVLENLELAVARQARIYCELSGAGMASESATRSIQGKMAAMQNALIEAQIFPDSVSYINASANGSIVGDRAEALAVQECFGDRSWELFVSSTKGAHGNAFSGSAAIESIFACMAIYSGIIPPTLNCEMEDNEFFLNFIPELNKEYYSRRKITLKNSFAYTGSSGCLCFRYCDPETRGDFQS